MRASAQPEFSLIVPTFNERENLALFCERVTRALASWPDNYEIIVVDDNSPDKTWQKAESLRARYPQLRVIRRVQGEKGLSPSVVEGWQAAQGQLLGVIDADLQHPPEILEQLLRAFQNKAVGIVIASRYTSNGHKLKWNPIRKWISRGASNLAQSVLPSQAHAVTDPMSGYFLLRRSVIDQISLQPRGYKILLEVLARGQYQHVAEVPYVFGKRFRGQSKLGAQVVAAYLTQLWKLAWAPTGFGRFVRYCLVGFSGVAINLGVVWWVREADWLGKLRAPALGIECAVINNFLWNELWTFRDRSKEAPRLRDRLKRFFHFNLICGAGAMIHLGMVKVLAINMQWPYMLTNVLGIIVVTLWNYGLNMSWTWINAQSTKTKKQ